MEPMFKVLALLTTVHESRPTFEMLRPIADLALHELGQAENSIQKSFPAFMFSTKWEIRTRTHSRLQLLGKSKDHDRHCGPDNVYAATQLVFVCVLSAMHWAALHHVSGLGQRYRVSVSRVP